MENLKTLCINNINNKKLKNFFNENYDLINFQLNSRIKDMEIFKKSLIHEFIRDISIFVSRDKEQNLLKYFSELNSLLEDKNKLRKYFNKFMESTKNENQIIYANIMYSNKWC